jgi:hypothetical protein
MIPKILHLAWGGDNEPTPDISKLSDDWVVRRWTDSNKPPGCVEDVETRIKDPKNRALYYRGLGLLDEQGVAIQHDVIPEDGFDSVLELTDSLPVFVLRMGHVDDAYVGIPTGVDISAFEMFINPSDETAHWMKFHRVMSEGSTPFVILPNKLFTHKTGVKGIVATHTFQHLIV